MSEREPYKYLEFDPRPDLFTYNAKRARKAARFFRQYLKPTGDHEGHSFQVIDAHAEILEAVYGWTWRDGPKAGQRRFRKVFVDGAKRLGKSPLPAGWGIYHLMFDSVVRRYVISTAATDKQAGAILRNAKEMIDLSPAPGPAVRRHRAGDQGAAHARPARIEHLYRASKIDEGEAALPHRPAG